MSKILRDHLIAQVGNRCSRCGWAEVNPTSGKVPLTVDHIDGDPTRSTPDNLAVLCPSCHSLTPTYGALNYGSGRDARKKNGAGETRTPDIHVANVALSL